MAAEPHQPQPGAARAASVARGDALPDSARWVVIGGGAVGLGVAYSLAVAGETDVVVIECQSELALATTSQGAGLAGQLRTSLERTQLAMHSVATFRELEAAGGVRPAWREVGSLRIALSEAVAASFGPLVAIARQAGLVVERISAEEVRRRWPALDVNNIRSALWCPTDGYMHPPSVAAAYADAARRLGVRIVTSTRVEGIALDAGRVAAVETDRGRVACQYAVNAAGAHAYHVARLVGLELPIVPVRHEYFVSVPIAGLHAALPCFRIPDLGLYGRAADAALLLGGWERTSLDADPRAYSLAAPAPPITPDDAVLTSFEERFAPLLPAVRGVARARIAKGWPTFTPDGGFLIGECRPVPGFVMAGGCNAHGISGSGGIGRLLVESLQAEHPSPHALSQSPNRFLDTPWDWESARRQARRVYETYYDVASC